MSQKEIKEEIAKLEEVIKKGADACRSWMDSKDGSHGACLDHHGVYQARSKIKELQQKLGE